MSWFWKNLCFLQFHHGVHLLLHDRVHRGVLLLHHGGLPQHMLILELKRKVGRELKYSINISLFY